MFFKNLGTNLAYYNTEIGGIYDRKTKKAHNAECADTH